MELFRIMPCRESALQATIEGFQQTGIPLITFNDECNLGKAAGLGPSGFTENVGSYYLIPKLVEWMNINLDAAILLFYNGIVFISFLSGLIGSWRLCQSQQGRWISCMALALLSFIIAAIGDYYILAGTTAIALVPWWLYLQYRPLMKSHFFYFAITGVILGISHYTRSHSGTGVLLFLLFALLISSRFQLKLKLGFLVILIAGFMSVAVYFETLIETRNTHLQSITTPHDTTVRRAFWHNVYYSLGYLYNYYGLKPSDSHSVIKARSIDPNISLFSPEYEELLRGEFFKFLKAHPFFVLNTLFAKFGICLMYLLIFGNIGLIYALLYPREVTFTLAFAIGVGFNMLFGLLATPDYQYFMGLFAFATLYGVYSIDHAMTQKSLKSSIG